MIQIDGERFAVGVVRLTRGENREYKYDAVTESGKRVSELRARYRTYSVMLGSMTQNEYDRLRRACCSGRESIPVTLPDGQEDVELLARVELGEDALLFLEYDGTRRWDGLTLEILGVTPLGAWE